MAEPDPVDESLALARRAFGASAETKARVRARVEARGAGAHEATRSAALPKVRARERLKTPLGAAALVGLGFIAGYWLAHHPEHEPLSPGSAGSTLIEGPRRADLEAPAQPAVAEGAAAEGSASEQRPSADAALERGPTSSSLRRARPSPAPRLAAAPSDAERLAPAPPHDEFLDELAFLARVERAIRAGRAELALTLLEELEQRHPHSSLVEERAAARLLADCLRHEPTARARAERFVREQAASVYVARVRQTCEVGAKPSTRSHLLDASRSKGRAGADTDLEEGGPHVQTP